MKHPALNAYQRRLGAPDPGHYRQPLPKDPSLLALLPPGSLIRTSYGTGGEVEQVEPYVERAVDGTGLACWTIVYNLPGARCREHTRGWINEVVVRGGRLLFLFEANTDEVFIARVGAVAQHSSPPPSADDLPLFAWTRAA